MMTLNKDGVMMDRVTLRWIGIVAGVLAVVGLPLLSFVVTAKVTEDRLAALGEDLRENTRRDELFRDKVAIEMKAEAAERRAEMAGLSRQLNAIEVTLGQVALRLNVTTTSKP
jgi:uncharacterized membrane-anchored protein